MMLWTITLCINLWQIEACTPLVLNDDKVLPQFDNREPCEKFLTETNLVAKPPYSIRCVYQKVNES